MAVFMGVTALTSCSCSNRGGLDGKTKFLRRPLGGKGQSMDPHRQFDAYSSEVVVLLFDSLFMTHFLKRPLEFVPNLAADMPEFSKDGKEMRIRLREDVKFQDADCFPGGKGRALVADDVVYSLTRFSDPFVNANSYSLIEGLIVGLDDARKKMEKLGEGKYKYADFPVEGLQAVDSHTVVIRLTRSTKVPMQVMAKSITSIVPRECVEKYGEDFQFHPVGTGPFKLKYTNRIGDVWMVKNPDYHLVYPSEGEPGDAEKGLLQDAGKRLPLVDELYMPVVAEAQPQVLKFSRGYFDWIGLDSDSVRRMARRTPDGGFELQEKYQKDLNIYAAKDSSSYWIAINLKNPVLGKNVKLRQALGIALDRQKYVDDVLNGRGVVLDSIVPETIGSNAAQLGVKWPAHDLARAKKLLEEAGHPEGKGLPIFKFLLSSGGNAQRQFEFIRRSLAEAGIKIELNTMPYASFLKKIEEGDFDLTICGWGADYPDAENFTSLLTTLARSQGQNYGNYANKRYDELSDLTKITPPGPQREAYFKEMAELVVSEVPVIPLFGAVRVGVYPKEWVRNFKRDLEMERDAVHINIDVSRQMRGINL